MKFIFHLVVRRAGWITFFSAVLATISVFFTVELYKNLRPDIEELLPNTSRSVVDLTQVVNRLVSSDGITILVFSENVQKSKEFVVALEKRLNQFPKNVVAKVETNIQEAVEFFDRRRALYIETEDLRAIDRYIRDKIEYERTIRNPLTIFSGVDLPLPRFDFAELQRRYEQKASSYASYPDDYYASPDQKIRAVLVGIANEIKGISGSHQLRSVIDQAITEVDPKKYAADIEFKFTGGVQDLIEEHASLVADLELVTIIVVIITALAMLIFFRTIMGTMALILALLIGTLWTFALTYYFIGYLNANSAFLGAIVIGNGVNFGIIYLARYIEELKKGRQHIRATYYALSKTPKATLTAALAAGFAYGSLAFTEFRGFRQFGVIGLMGMVLCWVSAYTTLPATLTLIDKIRPIVSPMFRKRKKRRQRRFFSDSVAWLIYRFPKSILAVSVLATVVSVGVLLRFDGQILETDLSQLRDQESIERGSAYNSHYLHQIFTSYPNPMAVMAQTEEQTRKLDEAFRQASRQPGSTISKVLSLRDFLPVNVDEKIQIISSIRSRITPEIEAELAPEERAAYRSYFTREVYRPFSKQDLPEVIQAKLRERDGSIGKLVLVEPFVGKTEDISDLSAFIDEVRATADSVQPGTPVAGQLAVTSDMIRAISRDGPIATALAFGAVIILVIFLFRSARSIGFVLFSLLLGVLWLSAIVVAFDLKINFLNFIAYPITFGIGVDYGVNIFQRYQAEGGRNILRVIRFTGGAVGLASLTTIVGYGALLIAGNQAFVSFGRLAVLGEVTCLFSAMLSLPAAIVLWDRRSRRLMATSKAKAAGAV